jgi:ribosomal-protein-alanine N-acetyltransferase
VEADRAPFAALNADPEVMRHMPRLLSREESDAVVQRLQAHFERHGFSFFAVELPGVAPFAGFIGLLHCPFEAHFTPAVEIGWRLAREHWGKGYVTEAARACLDYAFSELALDEVVSITVPANTRSWAVMERLGMRRDPSEDFEHPLLPEGHPLRLHVLYRLRPSVGPQR